ncbi:hypothetical protein MNV49_007257 [Pseudohyphozyma bogoriensis]|nr:hypothetical protein MNV49_007257 [Pseudohyphozyma bogoriensis]
MLTTICNVSEKIPCLAGCGQLIWDVREPQRSHMARFCPSNQSKDNIKRLLDEVGVNLSYSGRSGSADSEDLRDTDLRPENNNASIFTGTTTTRNAQPTKLRWNVDFLCPVCLPGCQFHAPAHAYGCPISHFPVVRLDPCRQTGAHMPGCVNSIYTAPAPQGLMLQQFTLGSRFRPRKRTGPWAQRATLALAEVDASVTKVEIDLKNKPEWYASKVNPASKVPVIQVGADEDPANVRIPESHVILELVADLYKDSPKSILPETPVSRAEARYFIERFNQVVWSKTYPILASGDKSGVPDIIKGLEEISGLLQRHPGPFFLGEKLSIAEVGVAPFLGRLLTFGKAGVLDDELYSALITKPELKPLAEYAELLTSRPAFKATFDADYLVAKQKERAAAFNKL